MITSLATPKYNCPIEDPKVEKQIPTRLLTSTRQQLLSIRSHSSPRRRIPKELSKFKNHRPRARQYQRRDRPQTCFTHKEPILNTCIQLHRVMKLSLLTFLSSLLINSTSVTRQRRLYCREDKAKCTTTQRTTASRTTVFMDSNLCQTQLSRVGPTSEWQTKAWV